MYFGNETCPMYEMRTNPLMDGDEMPWTGLVHCWSILSRHSWKVLKRVFAVAGWPCDYGSWLGDHR